MLPTEKETVLPKSVLRYVWSVKVLKAGLGVQTENEVRQWFYENPLVLNEFETLNRELAHMIRNMQQQAVDGLRDIVMKQNGTAKGFKDFEMDVKSEDTF